MQQLPPLAPNHGACPVDGDATLCNPPESFKQSQSRHRSHLCLHRLDLPFLAGNSLECSIAANTMGIAATHRLRRARRNHDPPIGKRQYSDTVTKDETASWDE